MLHRQKSFKVVGKPLQPLVRLVCALGAVLACAAPAWADSWLPATVKTYEAADHSARLTVSPRGIESPLKYFEDKVDGTEPAGQKPGAEPAATGVLEVRDGAGWKIVWKRALVNDVAPVHALVAPGGRWVVTFDNWHSMGWGDDVVVIYGGDGTRVRSLSLNDLLPKDYVEALPRSVSSIWWSGEHRFSPDEATLLLQIVIPGDTDEDKRVYVELPVRLADGRVLTPDTEAWRAALAQASRVAAQKRADAAAWRAAFIAPLTGPEGADESAWHHYLDEAFFRLDPDWKDGYAAIKVLRAPDAADYAPSEDWLRETLLDKALPPRVVMIASPASPDNLVAVLERITAQVKPGALKKARLYVVAGDAWRARIQSALARTGAAVIVLDPKRPIPQRPERLKRLDAQE
jgi:hypothetical protein